MFFFAGQLEPVYTEADNQRMSEGVNNETSLCSGENLTLLIICHIKEPVCYTRRPKCNICVGPVSCPRKLGQVGSEYYLI